MEYVFRSSASVVSPTFRDSIVVSISACHADDPGSIPGRGVFSFFQIDDSIHDIINNIK